MNQFLFLLISISLMGCLRTRSDFDVQKIQAAQEQKTTLTSVVSSAGVPQVIRTPRLKAGLELQLQESQELIRALVGRLDALEKKIEENNSEQKLKQKLNEKLKFYEETLLSIDKRVTDLSKKIEKPRAVSKKRKNKKKQSKRKLSLYQLARKDFSTKNWKSAILKFQKFREKQSNGKRYIESTYKIGVSFMSLGLGQEAKVFFNEIISKFPKSQFAKKSKINLKAIK